MAWQTTCTVGQWPDQIRISAWFRMASRGAGPAERLAGCRACYGGPRWETPVADSDSRRPTDIRTPDQRLRVFASLTLGELNTERGAAREAIEQLRLAPVMFESGARPHPAQEVYRAYLEQSDVFVGIYWQRYLAGSAQPPPPATASGSRPGRRWPRPKGGSPSESGRHCPPGSSPRRWRRAAPRRQQAALGRALPALGGAVPADTWSRAGRADTCQRQPLPAPSLGGWETFV